MGDGFSNAILGGAVKLIRQAIQSPNFLTGVSGWTINKDGTVEFNNGTFRGVLTIGGSLLIYSGDDLVFAATPDGVTPAHTGNPLVFGKTVAPGIGLLAFEADSKPINFLEYVTNNNFNITYGQVGGVVQPVDVTLGKLTGLDTGFTIHGRTDANPSTVTLCSGPQGAYYQERLSLNAAQVIPSGAGMNILTGFTRNKLRSDYGSRFNLASGVWTCPVDGPYRFSANSQWGGAWVGGSRARIAAFKNGVYWTGPDLSQIGATGGMPPLTFEDEFVAGDTLDFRVSQITAANQTISGFIHATRTI